MTGPRLALTTWTGLKAPAGGRCAEVPWGELVERLRAPREHLGVRTPDEWKDPAACKVIGFGQWTKGTRSAAARESVSALVLDFDAHAPGARPELVGPARGEPDLTPDRLRAVLENTLPGRLWAAYTSASSSPAAWRWRVLLPLAEPAAPAELLGIAALVRGLLMQAECWAMEADPGASVDLARAWFPPVGHGAYAALEGSGAPLPAEVVREAAPGGAALWSALQAAREALVAEARRPPAPALDLDPEPPPAAPAEAPAPEPEPDPEPELPPADAARLARLRAALVSGERDWPEAPPAVASWADDEGELHPLLRRGLVALLSGEGGLGKSFAALDLAAAVALGAEWLGAFPCAEGAALVVSCEDDGPTLAARLEAICAARGLTPAERARVLGRVHRLDLGAAMDGPWKLSGEDGEPTDLAEDLLRLARLGAPPEGWALVVLDPVAQLAGGDVEKDARAATSFLAVARRFGKLAGSPAVLLPVHTAKGARGVGKAAEALDASSVRGSSGLVDGARAVLALAASTDPETRRVRPERVWLGISKLNGGKRPPWPALLLHRRAGGALVADSAGASGSAWLGEVESAGMTAAELVNAKAKADALELRREAEARKAASGLAYAAGVGLQAAKAGREAEADLLFGTVKAGSPKASTAAARVARDLPPADGRTDAERTEAAADYADRKADRARVAGEPEVAKVLSGRAAGLRGGGK
jgi:hypothetical protein